MQEKKRTGFSSKIGFVLAAASSAVGLGNMWRFPYLVARYGGGIFLLCYILLATTFGFVMLVSEIGIGRMTGQSSMGAFKSLDRRFGFCGILGLLIPALITPYYSVIGGWVLKYVIVFAAGQNMDAADDSFFGSFISAQMEPVLYLAIFIVLAAVIVLTGVDKGIEKASVIIMPILLLISVGIVIYTVTRPGAAEGLIYYLKPDFSKFSGKTVLAALGQLFYSLSLAMGIMVTYGSYMRKSDNLEGSVRQIEFFDSLVAILAGMMIVPAVYVFSGGNEEAMNAGAGLMFITLPKVFASFTGGRIVGLMFFVLVLFAALTSAISLLEAVVSNIIDITGWDRKITTILVTVYCVILAVPSSLGFGILSSVQILGMDILDFMDFITNTIMMPVLAFATCIFVGFVIKPKKIIDEAEAEGAKFHASAFYSFMVKWVAPIGILAIMASFIASSFGWLSW